MDDSRSQEEESGSDFPVGSIYAAKNHVSSGEDRVHAVIYVLHMADHKKRTHGLLHGADANRCSRVLPPEFVAQHARHSSRVFAARGQAGVYGEARAGSNT